MFFGSSTKIGDGAVCFFVSRYGLAALSDDSEAVVFKRAEAIGSPLD